MNTAVILSVRERIQAQGDLRELVELSLEELAISDIGTDIGPLLHQANNLEMLMLNDNDLENVDQLPPLALTVLDLSNNRYFT